MARPWKARKTIRTFPALPTAARKTPRKSGVSHIPTLTAAAGFLFQKATCQSNGVAGRILRARTGSEQAGTPEREQEQGMDAGR